ncbi:MAG: tRNA pseudouridine(38-40) synthase TruA [Muribaculaceae bacterium]|nr:tRNA pseudouridine(38-40) synthase TruA [Muribaculaceae bacterium]
MRWFIDLSYLGGAYHGWQVQPGAITVQEVLERALSTLFRCDKVAVTGAGRTDAGVNARRMIAHVDLPDDFDAASRRFLKAVNSLCGRDIAVYSFTPVAPDAHARFDATERTYRYFVHTAKNPFAELGGLSWRAPFTLDFEAMNRAGDFLLGIRDFTSFSKLHTDVKTNICDLRKARWERLSGREGDNEGRWYFEITADRFLRNMVRAVVGTLVDVGRGKMQPEDIIKILEAKNRSFAGTSMPGEALFLWDVKYPYYTVSRE